MGIISYLKSKKRKLGVLLIDVITFFLVDLMYYFNLTSTTIGTGFHKVFFAKSVILLITIFSMRMIMKVYRSVWRYPSTGSYFNIIVADALGGIAAIIVIIIGEAIFGVKDLFWRVFWHMGTVAAFTALATLASRFLYRMFYSKINNASDPAEKIPVAIVGAGQIGAILADDLLLNQNAKFKPMFFIDIDSSKTGNRISGLSIYPQDDKIIDIIRSRGIKELFVAIAPLSSETAMSIYNFYKKSGCKIKLYDSPAGEYVNGDTPPKKVIRDFQIEDLLFRKPMTGSLSAFRSFYADKVILVTGGGGSIGSELCRQLAKCSPKKLIVVDIYENNAYDIQQELTRKYGQKLDLCVEIASVRDRVRLESIFKAYRPQVVFHAAAHKHVPLMEHSSGEAVKNNVFGTYNTADMAEKYGVEKFILISTDKAVNPTNVMGASKRMCEMIVRCRRDGGTSFSAVRFGNVLGSNGSVIPLFKQQIAAGGPVTITDKRIIRYFMTIPEASQLVMRAGAMADRGELFVLDMGKPIKIYDLAQNMIRLSGFEPEVDIKIEEIGLRPGEKLYEELLIKTDKLTKTDDNMIYIEQEEPLSRDDVEKKLAILSAALESWDGFANSEDIKNALKKVVPTFVDPNKINAKAKNSEEMRKAEAPAETTDK